MFDLISSYDDAKGDSVLWGSLPFLIEVRRSLVSRHEHGRGRWRERELRSGDGSAKVQG
jgi:hypothetical protein